MKRIYDEVITNHFYNDRQMLFLSGPRQVGKTYLCKQTSNLSKDFGYLNWDNKDHRQIILAGPSAVAEYLHLSQMRAQKTVVVFDEIHKYSEWKNYIKGFFDTYEDNTHIVVTGSAKLNIFKKGNDSLMGRYFPYLIHPLSVAELVRTTLPNHEYSPPKKLDTQKFNVLYARGGFPEPYINDNTRFSTRWQGLKFEQLFREDVIDLSNIREIAQLELLAEILKIQSASLLNYTNLANKLDVTIDTIKRWLQTLKYFYYCFTIKPWNKNVVRSLLKEPKIYLCDWSLQRDPGKKAENFVACHLLKAISFWNDAGLGNYDLFFVRDKEKNEVDFLVTKNDAPWILIEVKQSANHSVSKSLYRFQKQTHATHAFQVAIDMEYEEEDCFKYHNPIIVPAKTFLSQLI